jgi:hypothetical protein
VAVIQLATSVDVEEVLGRNLTSLEMGRVNAILDKASELFRVRSRQQFTAGTSLVRLRVLDGVVRLSQRPVVSVESIATIGGIELEFTLFAAEATVNTSEAFVHVAYTHGGEVPDVVRLCIADVAKKVLLIAEKATVGFNQFSEGVGPFTESGTFATWAQGGQTMLAPDDNVLADSFRVKRGSLIVQSYE